MEVPAEEPLQGRVKYIPYMIVGDDAFPLKPLRRKLCSTQAANTTFSTLSGSSAIASEIHRTCLSINQTHFQQFYEL
jgi:hypothetical protein